MAKMRVYELAKELRLDSKELVRQLIEMDYDVRNHMSTLSKDEAASISEKLKAARSEVVEEKRVTTRVIRRRRKKIKSVEAAPVEAAPVEAAPVEAAPVQTPTLEEPPAGVPGQVDSAPTGTHPPQAQIQPEKLEGGEPGPEVEAEAPDRLEPGPEPEAAPQPELETPEALAPAEAEAAPPPSPEEAPTATPKEAQPQKAKGKLVKPNLVFGKPAKIISRPTRPVAPTERPSPGRAAPRRPGGRPGPGRVPIPPGEVPPPSRDDKGRPRHKKGKKAQQIPDDAFLMRKTKSRKREILDKADLYDKRPGRGRKRPASKKARKTELTTPKAIKRRIKVGEAILVSELAKRMGVKAAEMVGRLLQMGMMVTLNQSLDIEDATLVAGEFGFEVEKIGFEEEELLERKEDKTDDLKPRPPVVTIMGHVDHGKTSLLDTIRHANVVGGEAGGITQHIGAYNVALEAGGRVVFVDTPGHEAFTQMRARGAQVTDAVVLVVAADDGVMEQTREALNHSRAAGVPIVVAVNKIDKPGAEPDRVRRELAELDLVPESWGGDTIMIDVSAKTGDGVKELLEMLELQAEVMELTANPDKPARGRILEARLDKGRGPVATLLVQEGTLKAGDAYVCGVYHGKARALIDDRGRRVDAAEPSIPVEVHGLAGVPEAGDEFVVVENEKAARQIAEHRAVKKREAKLGSQRKLSLEGLFDQMQEGEVTKLQLVVKGDVQGSVEALVEALGKLGNEEVQVEVIHTATGAITDTDVMLAAASNAIIVGFNVRPAPKVAEVAQREGVALRTYEVIYKVLEDITSALTGMLAPIIEEEVIGRLEVRETFGVPKVGTIAGCAVTDGKITRSALVRLLREGVVITKTRVSSLRRFKDDVKEVAQGFECGVGLENYNDIKVGDEIEAFITVEKAAGL